MSQKLIMLPQIQRIPSIMPLDFSINWALIQIIFETIDIFFNSQFMVLWNTYMYDKNNKRHAKTVKKIL